MKDFNNNVLKIGDTVAFMCCTSEINSRASRSYLQKGIIIAFTEKMISIKCNERTRADRRLPNHVALIQEPVALI
jgi:hypothetical protein